MQAYGIKLQLSGQLIGPDPGRLEATTSWEKPAENLSGSGSFSGNIEKLGFRHVLKVPETVNFNGTIYNLFTEPELAGVADWSSIRLPVQKTLYSNAGNIAVSSNFRSAHLKGNNILLLEDWPKAPMQLDALIDLQGVRIDSYSLETLDGQVSGSGQIDYSEGLQGQLLINIGLRLTGSAQQVKTEPFSRPAMSENDVLMFLMLDRPASTGDDASGAALAPGLQQLVPLEGSRFGLDEVSFETNEANEAAMAAGKRINDKLYVCYVFGAMGQAGAFRIRYRLDRGLSLESSTGSQQSLDLIYMIER